MREIHQFPSPLRTNVLLVEADADIREQHAAVLRTAGYDVSEKAGLPSPQEVSAADLIMADEASFRWLHSHPVRRPRPFLVLTDDVKAGVTACLCGAADWSPVHADSGYLLNIVAEVCRGRH